MCVQHKLNLVRYSKNMSNATNHMKIATNWVTGSGYHKYAFLCKLVDDISSKNKSLNWKYTGDQLKLHQNDKGRMW